MGNDPITDQGEPIAASRLLNNGRECGFCEGPQHYGFCDPMRAYNDERRSGFHPLVNPIVRHG